jgi:hypothetical protein
VLRECGNAKRSLDSMPAPSSRAQSRHPERVSEWESRRMSNGLGE